MSGLSLVNPRAEHIEKRESLAININAAIGIQSVLKTNLGN